jgi:hypothetical protein
MIPAAPLPPALPHQLRPGNVGIISHFGGSHLPASLPMVVAGMGVSQLLCRDRHVLPMSAGAHPTL